MHARTVDIGTRCVPPRPAIPVTGWSVQEAARRVSDRDLERAVERLEREEPRQGERAAGWLLGIAAVLWVGAFLVVMSIR